MRWDDFRGNHRVIERLRTKMRESRFPHGLVFAGPRGVGKRTCALMIAKSLMCVENGAGDFCDACGPCRKIDAGTHPDVSFTTVEEGSSDIKIAQVRQLLQMLEMRPMEGSEKVFIVDPADCMTTGAANALLKGLEEPPENSYFILLTESLHALLVTVRSRAQCYPFSPLTSEEMKGLDGGELERRWSRGSVGLLKGLDVPSLKKQRESALEFLETAVRASESDFRDVLAVSSELGRAKSEFEPQLNAIAVLLCDVLYIQEGAAARIINIDLAERLTRLAADVPAAQLAQIADFLLTLEKNIERNVNRQMLTDVLALTSNRAVGKIGHDNP